MSFKGGIEYRTAFLADLKRYRQDAKLSQEDVAEALGFSLSKVSRSEQGRNEISQDDLTAYMNLYKVPKGDRLRLYNLREQGASQKDRWWESYGWMSAGYAESIEAEQAATFIRTSHPSYVPGLLQTPAYVRHICNVFGQVDIDEVEEVVEVRVKRQEVLTKSRAPRYLVVLAEGVFDIGPESVLREQLIAIRRVMELPNVELRALPSRAGVPIIEGTCMTLPQGKEKHVADIGAGGVVLDDPVLLRATRRRFDTYLKHTLSPEETETLVERKIREV